ncbi:putative ankyrin repeat-containing protein [Iris pallida]|uniref:Ankyrin repeat-containing protein n=1 Tax=Iris pallida TaxID=29817 RepID=A0AAX6G8I2_IRIPA|nr:putative ankyrin repeat-containing protein [Iris pallida]
MGWTRTHGSGHDLGGYCHVDGHGNGDDRKGDGCVVVCGRRYGGSSRGRTNKACGKAAMVRHCEILEEIVLATVVAWCR